ncbi:tetratricopeptide repeat-containing sensor histidine kinase [Hymenobacter sp.]|uniref:ATP-binding protein n=1 Tax=Hymenobacter sp. TaxID=1898978 RepID=UPI002ED7A919
MRQLPTCTADTSRLRTLAALCYELHGPQPKRAIFYGEQAIRLATRLNDKRTLLRVLLDLGCCYGNMADGIHAIKLQQKAAMLAQQLHDNDGLARAYTSIGGMYHERNDTARALHNYHRAIASIHSPGVRGSTQVMLYGNMGNLYSYLRNYPLALYYTRAALELARKSGDKPGESLYTANLGLFYLQQGKLNTAEGLARKALTLVEPLHNYRFEAGHLELLATILLLEKELDEAETLTRRALRLGRQVDFKTRILDAYNLLAEINAGRQNYEEAFRWQGRFRALNDSINSSSRLQAMAALQTRYDVSAKESQIRQLTHRTELQQHHNRELWVMIGALVLGLSGIGVLYWKLKRSRAALAANHAALHVATNELRELAASKDRLYTIVAHDLRGPVTAFVGVTELIDFYLKTGDEDGLQRLPALVRQSAKGLNGLLDNLLSWAVSQTGELVSQPEQLTIDDLFTEIEELYRTTAEAKQVQLTASSSLDLTVWADRNMTRTILRNLVGNALKFTPGGGAILLQATPSQQGDTLTLSVTDTGRGMAPEQVTALLTANPKRPAAARPNGPSFGTGLGLPLCRAFTERLGGRLVIDSTPGTGTVVRVVLPSHMAN